MSACGSRIWMWETESIQYSCIHLVASDETTAHDSSRKCRRVRGSVRLEEDRGSLSLLGWDFRGAEIKAFA
eukprot:251472-Amphidinium_carterae.2